MSCCRKQPVDTKHNITCISLNLQLRKSEPEMQMADFDSSPRLRQGMLSTHERVTSLILREITLCFHNINTRLFHVISQCVIEHLYTL
jgi:hypothetical protein